MPLAFIIQRWGNDKQDMIQNLWLMLYIFFYYLSFETMTFLIIFPVGHVNTLLVRFLMIMFQYDLKGKKTFRINLKILVMVVWDSKFVVFFFFSALQK